MGVGTDFIISLTANCLVDEVRLNQAIKRLEDDGIISEEFESKSDKEVSYEPYDQSSSYCDDYGMNENNYYSGLLPMSQVKEKLGEDNASSNDSDRDSLLRGNHR